MIPPSLPPDEPERLRSLRSLELLDTPPEERFDRITRIAQSLFDVPMALVSLVDADRQWFKSRQGIDVSETERAVSFCGHAIRGSDLFIVPDAAKDERFAGNPLVAGAPDVRFYAGAPLTAPDGHRIGALCLIDRRPRDLDPAQRKALRDLADLVEDEISLRTSQRASLKRETPPSGRRAARLKVTAAFGVAFLLLAAFTVLTRRALGRISAEALNPARASETAADIDSLARLQGVATVARATVLALALLALLWDMSAREKAEDALRRSRDEALEAAEGRRVAQAEAEKLGERLSAVLDHVDVGVVMIDLEAKASIYNVAAERIHGAWRDEMQRLYAAGTHPMLREDEKTPLTHDEDPVAQALKGETVRGARVFMRTPFRPKGYHLVISAVPLRDHRGMQTGAVLMFTERAPG